MEDDQNGRRPNGRRQKWKKTKIEDDQNERLPKSYNIKKSKNQEMCINKKCGVIYMSTFAVFFIPSLPEWGANCT